MLEAQIYNVLYHPEAMPCVLDRNYRKQNAAAFRNYDVTATQMHLLVSLDYWMRISCEAITFDPISGHKITPRVFLSS